MRENSQNLVFEGVATLVVTCLWKDGAARQLRCHFTGKGYRCRFRFQRSRGRRGRCSNPIFTVYRSKSLVTISATVNFHSFLLKATRPKSVFLPLSHAIIDPTPHASPFFGTSSNHMLVALLLRTGTHKSGANTTSGAGDGVCVCLRRDGGGWEQWTYELLHLRAHRCCSIGV